MLPPGGRAPDPEAVADVRLTLAATTAGIALIAIALLETSSTRSSIRTAAA